MPPTREKIVTVRMTPSEAERVTKRARALGISREEYIRDALMRSHAKMQEGESDERLLIALADSIGSVIRDVRTIEKNTAETNGMSEDDRLALRRKLDEICRLFHETKMSTLELEIRGGRT